MHNTILLTFMLMLTTVSASAQFHTVTRDSEIDGKPKAKKVEISVIKEDTMADNDTVISVDCKTENEENLGQKVLNARKSDDSKFLRNDSASEEKSGVNGNPTAQSRDNSLPELTIPNLLAEIKKNNIKFPKIVLAQAILETGWFKSSVCRNKHNLFGLTNPRTKDYYGFNHWTESVRAYYTKVQHRYYQKDKNITGEVDYLIWLRDSGYAEDKGYVRAIIRVLRTLDNR